MSTCRTYANLSAIGKNRYRRRRYHAVGATTAKLPWAARYRRGIHADPPPMPDPVDQPDPEPIKPVVPTREQELTDLLRRFTVPQLNLFGNQLFNGTSPSTWVKSGRRGKVRFLIANTPVSSTMIATFLQAWQSGITSNNSNSSAGTPCMIQTPLVPEYSPITTITSALRTCTIGTKSPARK